MHHSNIVVFKQTNEFLIKLLNQIDKFVTTPSEGTKVMTIARKPCVLLATGRKNDWLINYEICLCETQIF